MAYGDVNKWKPGQKNNPGWYKHPSTGERTYWTGSKWQFKDPKGNVNLKGAAGMRAGQVARATQSMVKKTAERLGLGSQPGNNNTVEGRTEKEKANITKNDKDRRTMSPSQFFGTNQYGAKRNSEPDKGGDKGGDKQPPAPQLSARQKELQSINKDKSLSSMDKWVKANRKMIESVGTKRQREMLADYKKRQTKTKSKADGKVGDFSSKRTGNIA